MAKVEGSSPFIRLPEPLREAGPRLRRVWPPRRRVCRADGRGILLGHRGKLLADSRRGRCASCAGQPTRTRPGHGVRRRCPDQRGRLRARAGGRRDLCRQRRRRAGAAGGLRNVLSRRHADRSHGRRRTQELGRRASRRLGARNRARDRARRHSRIARARPHRARGGHRERGVPRRRLALEPSRGDRGEHRPRRRRLDADTRSWASGLS